MNADGSDQRRLTHSELSCIPDWSPDGTAIVFHAHHGEDVWSIEVIHPDGSNWQRLTFASARDAGPVWSPDGTQIAFSSDRTGNSEIYVMAAPGAPDADGQEPRQLTDLGADTGAPDWSPDGTKIAFSSDLDGDSEIYVMDADGGNQRQLTDDDTEDWWPAWSPDGTRIAWMSKRDGNWEIYVMAADGRHPQRLTDDPGEDWQPAWSPDGTRIAWNSNRDGDDEIYVMAAPGGPDADGSGVQQLTENRAMDWGPVWRPIAPAPGSTAPPAQADHGDTWSRPADGMVMVYVPAGEFPMGSDEGDDLAFDDEFPQHTVYLDAFWIDRTEVTVAMFRAYVGDTGHVTTAEEEGGGYAWVEGEGWKWVDGADWQHPFGQESAAQDDHPVVQVSGYDVMAYCEWAGGQLPTEAQWEKAAWGTDERIYPWGDAFGGNELNYCDANCPGDWRDEEHDDGYAFTAPVGSYPDGVSPYGALDMAGNVWEWVSDWYDGEYYRL